MSFVPFPASVLVGPAKVSANGTGAGDMNLPNPVPGAFQDIDPLFNLQIPAAAGDKIEARWDAYFTLQAAGPAVVIFTFNIGGVDVPAPGAGFGTPINNSGGFDVMLMYPWTAIALQIVGGLIAVKARVSATASAVSIYNRNNVTIPSMSVDNLRH